VGEKTGERQRWGLFCGGHGGFGIRELRKEISEKILLKSQRSDAIKKAKVKEGEGEGDFKGEVDLIEELGNPTVHKLIRGSKKRGTWRLWGKGGSSAVETKISRPKIKSFFALRAISLSLSLKVEGEGISV